MITLVNNPTQADIVKIYEFAGELFKMCLKWVEIFPKYINDYKLACKHPNLFLVEKNAAIASCGYEIFSMLQQCFGCSERANKFMMAHQNKVCVQNEYAEPEAMSNNGLMLSLVGQFGSLGGFK